MTITSFGGLLTFAEQMETLDMEFYSGAVLAAGMENYADLFSLLVKNTKKNIAHIQRTRRENITEMILEPISGIAEQDFMLAELGGQGLTPDRIMGRAVEMENRALGFYSAGAEKIKALAEVARALKRAGKTRKANIKALQEHVQLFE